MKIEVNEWFTPEFDDVESLTESVAPCPHCKQDAALMTWHSKTKWREYTSCYIVCFNCGLEHRQSTDGSWIVKRIEL